VRLSSIFPKDIKWPALVTADFHTFETVLGVDNFFTSSVIEAPASETDRYRTIPGRTLNHAKTKEMDKSRWIVGMHTVIVWLGKPMRGKECKKRKQEKARKKKPNTKWSHRSGGQSTNPDHHDSHLRSCEDVEIERARKWERSKSESSDP